MARPHGRAIRSFTDTQQRRDNARESKEAMRTKNLATLAGLTIGALALAGCSSSDSSGSDDMITIGINQLVQHASLDASAEGFKQAFIDAGYVEGETVEFDEQNANGESATATSIASNFKNSGVDLVLAIATPAAQATVQSITDIPVLFTAVTDPVDAGLVASIDAPGDNVSGTSDLTPVDEQIELLTEIAPEAETIGVIYSTGEDNSRVQVDMAIEAAEKHGLTVKEATATNGSEVAQAAQTLTGVDAIYVPTDNVVVAAIEGVVQVSEEHGIPLIVGEGDSVQSGGLATIGLDYFELGYQTGEMAIRILEDGADPAETPVEYLAETSLIVNTAAAERMGITLSDELIARADTVVED